jgi:nicotinamidase/pyrazinamidase
MKQRALLLVDLQNDFCAGGALAVAEGDSTVDVANTLIDWCQARGEPVLATQDWHPANHGSFASQHQVAPFHKVCLMAWRKPSGRIIAYSTAKARRYIPC